LWFFDRAIRIIFKNADLWIFVVFEDYDEDFLYLKFEAQTRSERIALLALNFALALRYCAHP